MSGDGRLVAFSSDDALVPADTNGVADIYLRDCQTPSTELISVSLSGTAGNHISGSLYPLSMSSDGRHVVFWSAASNLVPNYTPGFWDVFRRDRLTGTTELISVGIGGQQGNGGSDDGVCSRDGRYIAFMSAATNMVANDTNNSLDVFLRDTVAQTTIRVSSDSNGMEGNGSSWSPALSPDGRFVAFTSLASNLVPGDTNSVSDVFLHDRFSRRTERISLKTSGLQSCCWSGNPALSIDAGRIVFRANGPLVPGDTGGVTDVYLRDCPLPSNYCTAKINSQGCLPTVETTGVPLASWPQDFDVSARHILNQKAGMLVYSTTGSAATPFVGGTLCIQQPLRRTPPQDSGGSTAGSDCTGAFTFNVNGWIASGLNPALTAGTSVWAQYWSRDPGFQAPNNISLSDATTFVIWP